MEKEINELKDLLTDLKELFKDKGETSKEAFYTLMREALKDSCEISIKKDKNDSARCKIEGTKLSIIITLIGAKRNILKKLNCSEEEFKFIEQFIECEVKE